MTHIDTISSSSSLSLDETIHGIFWPVDNFTNILRAPFLYKSAFFYLHITREKLPKRLSYEKGACKMLVQLTPVNNFTNILRAPSLFNKVLRSLNEIEVWVCNLSVKRKLAQKLLVKCWWNRLQVSISSMFHARFFSPISFCQKVTKPKRNKRKAAWSTFVWKTHA